MEDADDFKEKLISFFNELSLPEPKERKIIVYTGSGGQKLLDNAILKELYGGMLKDCLKQKSITEKEHDNLSQMLYSNDPESVTLSIEIIKLK